MLHSVFSPARIRVAAPLVALALVVAGCRGDRDTYEELAERAAERNDVAKQYLAEGRYTDAKLQFEDVLTNVDGTNAEARFGAVLSELLQFVSIIRVISQLTGDTAQADENEFLHALIDDLVSDLITRFDDLAFELKRLKPDATFRFVLDQPTPVYLTSTDDPDLDLEGEWDRGEVFLLDVGVQAVLGVLNLVQAYDLRGDYLGIFDKFTELDIDLDLTAGADLDGDGEADLDGILSNLEREIPKFQNLIAFVLNDNPRLLALDQGTGKAQLSQAGLHLANAIDSLRKALYFASQDIEADPDQSDDVIAFAGEVPIDPDDDLCAIRDRDDSGELDEHTYTFKLHLLEVDAGDEEELETDPTTGCFVTKLMNSLLPDDDERNEDTDARINLIRDAVPFALGLADEDVQNAITPDVVESFIGDAVELDLGPFFHDGVGIRDLLVAWDTPAIEPDADLRLLWAELECTWDPGLDDVASERGARYPEFTAKLAGQPYRMFDRLFCREADDDDNMVVPNQCDADGNTECDVEHFPGYDPESMAGGNGNLPALVNAFGVSQIGQDGVDGQMPYLAFQDPTMNGLLYLDLDSAARAVFTGGVPDELRALDGDRGFEAATQRTLNAYIALVSVQVTPLLDLIP